MRACEYNIEILKNQNENLQTELSQNIKKLAKPNATKDIVEEIVKLV